MSNTDERMNPFPPVSKSAWLAKVEADLKGASPDRLRSKTAGGLDIEPLYTAEDAVAPDAGFPGVYPYVRGATPLARWVVRQEYDDPRPSVCKAQIAQDLGRGVEALWLRIGPRHGCRVLTTENLDDVLGATDLGATSVYVEGGSDALAVAAGFLAVAERRGVSREALRGGFAFDPIGLLAREGRIQGGLRARLAELCDLAAWCAQNAPGLRAVDVSGDAYDGGGASEVQELAYTIATGIEYLRQLTKAGIRIEDAARQIGFSYAVSGDFFTQIAKLRAARGLWAKVISAAGGEPSAAAMSIHARTSSFTMAKRDPWVNMLRVTAECTAAVLGGAQSVATQPFDAAIGPPDELARRVARNTQIVLRDESHLDAVADAAGGSWFVETLTDQLARAAWKEIRSIEGAGGIVQALGSGRIVDAIDAVAKVRQHSIAKRKAPILGVSEFPNATEQPVHRDPVPQEEIKRMLRAGLDELDVGAHRDVLLGLARQVNDPDRAPGALTEACVAATSSGTDIYSVAAVLQHGQPDFHVEPIRQWRAAEAWERLRDRSDRSETRPKAFMANLGSIPSHKARSTWAQNLLAAVGVSCSTNEGFGDPKAIEAAWRDAPASLAVICGSDEDYESMLEPAVVALKKAGCPIVLVAGRPGERAAALREAG
ncbi:MAG: methylmalonyl-CoA mutase subunit beta, partial [Polyangiales bacterium]